MNIEARIAFVQAQTACALIELEGMRAANAQYAVQGNPPCYAQRDFDALLNKYLIGHNEVIDYLRE